MKNKIYIPILVAVILGFSSCTERIDVELNETYTRLIVEGNLTTDTMAHLFVLSKTTSYFYNQPAPAVENASVSITDNLGNRVQLEEKEPGKYYTPASFFGLPNRTYELQIDLEEEINENSRYEAQSAIPAPRPIDSIGMELNKNFGKEGFWIVKLFATDPGGVENFYQFRVFRNDTLLSDSLSKVNFTDDKLFDGNFTYGIGVAFFNNLRPDQRFRVGDTVVLEMGCITKEHYTFMNNVIQSTSFQNPLFGGPPANVIGNISNGAFGYFSAFSTSYSQIILTEDNIIITE
jgi:hypothetical protein